MHVAVAGPPDAEPLVLLHGWPQHWYAWRRLIGPLSERYRVIAPDLRGFGWTDAPRRQLPEGAARRRRHRASSTSLGLERVRLAGHDWGGFAGFLLCLDAPGALLALRRRRNEPPVGRARDRRRRDPASAAPARLHGADRLAGARRPGRPAGARRSRGRSSKRAPSIPDRTWTDAELETFVAQWSEPDRAAACVGIYRSFLTKELRQLASGVFRLADDGDARACSSSASPTR